VERTEEVVDYNAPQPGMSYEQKAMNVEYWIAKQIGTDLCKHYPNRQWHVDVDCANQVIVIACPSLSKRMGYRLHMKRDTVADLLPRCRRAAGEILERYGVSRTRIIDPMTMEEFPRDMRDDVISGDSQTDKASRL
jgi:hypothetical protein